MYIIEQNIPIPQAKTGRNSLTQATITFTAMSVGDSMVVPTVLDVKRVRNTAWRQGKKMTSRKIERGVFRIWRTA